MKIKVFVMIIILMAALAMFLSMGPRSEQQQQVAQSSDHVYASWETMEFDKCVAAWLIIRFIDKDAKFVFYPGETEITEGIVFDVPGALWSRQHRKCTSDCVLETIESPDDGVKYIVSCAQNVELNFWQLDSFPDTCKHFDEVKGIFDITPDRMECLEKTQLYFDRIYENYLNKVE